MVKKAEKKIVKSAVKKALKTVEKKDKIVEKTISEILELLDVKCGIEVKENDEGFDVTLDTEDNGVLIGYHGETLDSLQLITSLAVAKKLGEFKRISIEVGDYKKNRSEYLTNLAFDTKEKVVSENKEIYLPDLKPWERRIVHMLLQDDKEVLSESVGEGRDRTLVIKPR